MKIILFIFCVSIVFVFVPLSVAQECNELTAGTTNNQSFIDHGDGAVSDLSTGLMWTKCVVGLSGDYCDEGTPQQNNWKESLQSVQEISVAGYIDWRLPNNKELSSIVERKCYVPAILVSIFPGTQPGSYWSASQYMGKVGHAWSVGFKYGGNEGMSMSDLLYIRAVRNY